MKLEVAVLKTIPGNTGDDEKIIINGIPFEDTVGTKEQLRLYCK